jgi:endonuclease YncB( thermonuclease family)
MESAMPLTVIKGHYRIIGAAPDGDSIRFYPTQKDAFTRAGIKSVRTNATGGAQLRLDAIDALETHYSPRVGGLGELHQPVRYGDGAAERLPQLLGFSSVTRGANQVVTASEPETTPGYILTRFADKYGRCVAFAFPGDIDHDDLTPMFVDAAAVETSVNAGMLKEGLAYPTYYSKLFPDLRAALTADYLSARGAASGLWADDVTETGVKVNSLTTLTDDAVILPKLFRRLVDYIALNHGDVDLGGFSAYLATVDDRLILTTTSSVTGFDNVMTVSGQTVTLNQPPENLIFIEG